MKFAELFEREAGHILVGFTMMLLGAGFHALAAPKGEDVIVAGLTLVVRAMIGHGNGKSKEKVPDGTK